MNKSLITFIHRTILTVLYIPLFFALASSNDHGFETFYVILALIAGIHTLAYWLPAYKRNWLKNTYLPFINDYKNYPAYFNPQFLDPDHQRELIRDASTMARLLLAYADDVLLSEFKLARASDPRDVCRRLIFTERHFSRYWTNSSIERTFLPLKSNQELVLLEAALRAETKRNITADGGVIVGTQVITDPPLYHEHDEQTIYIPLNDRFRHLYGLGKTGSGKSTTSRSLIEQDLRDPTRGVILISPEDAIFQSLLLHIPKEREDDLLYFEPTDTAGNIISFNPFDFSEYERLPPHERDAYLSFKAGETYTVFERALGGALGVKSVTIWQNVAYALLQLNIPEPRYSIADIDSLLHPHDTTLREIVVASPYVDDRTRAFWREYDGVNAAYYKSTYNTVMNRLEAFMRPPLSQVLGSSSFSFEDVMNGERAKILFINLSKLRGQQAQILGQLIIALIQQTLQRREHMPEHIRAERPIMTYIDEFALFASSEQAMVDLFARGRKYRMGCAVFHQTTSDLPSSFLDIIIGNVGSQIIMQLAAGDASYFAKELQLTEYDELKARKLRDQEAAKLERETRRIYRETGERVDLLADPMDVHRIQKKIQDYSSGGLMPALLQNLNIGQAIVKTSQLMHGVGTAIPYLKDPDTRDYDPRPDLISRSKKNYGKPLELRRNKTKDNTPAVVSTSTPSTTDQDDGQAELILC